MKFLVYPDLKYEKEGGYFLLLIIIVIRARTTTTPGKATTPLAVPSDAQKAAGRAT